MFDVYELYDVRGQYRLIRVDSEEGFMNTVKNVDSFSKYHLILMETVPV